MRFGSLFAGIGGIDLGLERAGMTCAWQVEKDEFCRKVLAKHWPDVPRYEDVRDVDALLLKPVDLIAGGFPCQDISQAASGWDPPGIDGERSGLWAHFTALLGALRPRWVVVENVAFLRRRGLHRVLGDLAHLGYDAEWDVFPASAVGAPHARARLWLVAYTHDEGKPDRPIHDEASVLPRTGPPIRPWPDPPHGMGVADGVPHRMDRLRALGNAVVPQVAEWIARRILAADGPQP